MIGFVPVCVDDSRPSHIRVLRNRRLVDGRGRRYMDNVVVLLQPYGLLTLTTVNSALAGTVSAMRIKPLLVSRLYAVRRASSVEVSIGVPGTTVPSTISQLE